MTWVIRALSHMNIKFSGSFIGKLNGFIKVFVSLRPARTISTGGFARIYINIHLSDYNVGKEEKKNERKNFHVDIIWSIYGQMEFHVFQEFPSKAFAITKPCSFEMIKL